MASLWNRVRGLPPRQPNFKPLPKRITGADISPPFSTGNEASLSPDIGRDWIAAQHMDEGGTTKSCPRCDEFRRELERADERQVEHEENVHDLIQQIKSLNEKDFSQRNRVKSQESAIERMEAAQIEMATQLQKAENKLRKTSEEVKILHKELNETQQKCTSLTRELSASEETNEQLRQLLKTQPVSKASQAQKAENARLTATNADLVRHVNTARAQEAENARLMAENSALVQQGNVAQAQLQDLQSSITRHDLDFEKQISAVRAETDRLRDRLQYAEDDTVHVGMASGDSGSNAPAGDQEAGPLGAAEDEVEQLRSDLQAANAHIVTLGSNFGTVISRGGAAKAYTMIRDGVQDWYETYVEPTIRSSNADRINVLTQAHLSGDHLRLQGDAQHRSSHFMTASNYAGTDQDIVCILIFDFLAEHIFSDTRIYDHDEVTQMIKAMEILEHIMAIDSRITNSVFTARQWTSQAKSTLLSSPRVKPVRECFVDLMVDRLLVETGLGVFIDPPVSSTGQDARAALRKAIVLPAVKLQDKFRCAIDKFTVEVRGSQGLSSQPDFIDHYETLNCKNVGDGSRRPKLERLKEKHSDDVIRKNMKIICAKVPALVVRQTQHSGFGKPVIAVKPEFLVVWRDPGKLRLEEEREEDEEGPALAEEDRGFMWLLFRKWFPASFEMKDESVEDN